MRNFNILPEASERIGLDYNRLLEYIRDDLKPLMEGRLGAGEFWKKSFPLKRAEDRRGILGGAVQPRNGSGNRRSDNRTEEVLPDGLRNKYPG